MTDQTTFTVEEILEQLDACANERTFPALDNAHAFLADVRLTGYADRTRWALIIEVIGFQYPSGFPDGLQVALYCFGNCLKGQPGMGESIETIAQPPGFQPSEEDIEEYGESVPLALKQVLVRGVPVSIPDDPAVFAAKGIELEAAPRLTGEELLRVLLPEHRSRLLATEEELRTALPADLPRVFLLDEWEHPDVRGAELPSETLTFHRIAEALVVGDPNCFVPTPDSNTHWENWPAGGNY